MSVTTWKTPAEAGLPPLCPDCCHCLARVKLLDGSVRPVCTHPHWRSPQLAWTARHALGCGYEGQLFEPRPIPSAGPTRRPRS